MTLQATTTGGTWSGTGVSSAGVFTPAQAGPGVHQIAHALSTGPTCTYRDTVTITVNPAAARIIRPSLAGLSCARDTTVLFTASAPGGVWSGPGIANPQTGAFQSVLAGPGRHVITYALNTPCGGKDTLSAVVRPVAVRVLSTPAILCGADTVLTLRATPAGGRLRGSGITDQGRFTSPGSGRYVLRYELGSGACHAADSVAITISPSLRPVINLLSTLRCGEPVGVLRVSNVLPGNITYEWQFSATNSLPWQRVSTQPMHQPIQPGWYRLQLRQGGCSAFVSHRVSSRARAGPDPAQRVYSQRGPGQ